MSINTSPATGNRVPRCFALRTPPRRTMHSSPAPPQIDNGDEARYSDKSGTYTKGILQTGIGLVDLAAYQTFKKALNSGNPADFENITLGGPRTLNGPQGGLAFDLECLDSSQFPVPPAPALASEVYATELVELYWASLLRDVAFTDYASNSVAVKRQRNCPRWPVTLGREMPATKLLRTCCSAAAFAGETIGPYISQFLLQDTSMGALPIVQKYTTFKEECRLHEGPYDLSAGAERHFDRIATTAGHTGLPARWTRAGRVYSRGCALSGILYSRIWY